MAGGRWLLVMLALASCASPAHRRAPVVPVGAGPIAPLPTDDRLRDDQRTTAATPARLESTHEIRDLETWHRLAARPASAAVARTEVVKFLVDLHDDRRLWLVDTERWDIHYFFARDRLSSPEHPVEDHAAFNSREYRREDRRFEMGSVVHYLDSDLWTLELISGDTLGGERIVRLFEQIRAAVPVATGLRFRPTSLMQEEAIAAFRDRLPVATADEVFAGIRYQPLTQGIAFGTLRIVRGTLDPATVRPDQILVLEHLPDEIPVASGVITNELQAPLGHIAVLCATRGTPNMALRGALEHPELARLDGHLVELVVGTQDFGVHEASHADAEAAWAARRPAQPQVPRLDRSRTQLVPVCDLDIADAPFAGAKAAQLGEACRIGWPIQTPGGFAIPVAHYLQHLEDHGIAGGIPQMLWDVSFRSDAHVRAARLAQLRAMIQSAPVDPRLLREVRRRIQRTDRRGRWILRSSTNAEDLAGFTGAGLYRSVVIPADASEAQIADAMREVWASVWLQGAFEEREWYRVDHRAVAMAILAQPFVDGASANGVAITANPFYEARPGFFVNAQALGGSVTGAAGEEVPEQHLIYTYGEVIESELLSRSTRTAGQQLLTEVQILDLASVLTVLHEHFVEQRWGGRRGLAVDVEFLVANGRIVVVQARPFHVVYGPGQTWD